MLIRRCRNITIRVGFCEGQLALTFTPPESAPSGQFWGIYALIGGVRVNKQTDWLGNGTGRPDPNMLCLHASSSTGFLPLVPCI